MDVTVLSALGILVVELLRTFYGIRTESLESAYELMKKEIDELRSEVEHLRDRTHQLETELAEVKQERQYWRDKFMVLQEQWQDQFA